MGFVTGREALSVRLERATLNWFAMGEKDDAALGEMRDLYSKILEWDTLTLSLVPDPSWTVDSSCKSCGEATTATASFADLERRYVRVNAGCQKCGVLGDEVVDRESFFGHFPPT